MTAPKPSRRPREPRLHKTRDERHIEAFATVKAWSMVIKFIAWFTIVVLLLCCIGGACSSRYVVFRDVPWWW